MEWTDAIKVYGLPGLIIAALYMLCRDALSKAHERDMLKLQQDGRRIDIDEKRADLHVTTLTNLIGKVDAHATADLKSHQDMAEGIAGLHGRLDGIFEERERTPVEGVGRVTPPQGVGIHSGYRPPRPGTKER